MTRYVTNLALNMSSDLKPFTPNTNPFDFMSMTYHKRRAMKNKYFGTKWLKEKKICILLLEK